MNSAPILRRIAVAATSVLAPGTAHAENFPKAVYAGAKADIKSTYQAEREACNSLAGNAKDICVAAAKGNEKVAMVMLDYNHSSKASDEARFYQSRYEARYDLAKEKCEALSGDAKSICMASAKARYNERW